MDPVAFSFFLLKTFIRRGTFRVTTSRGNGLNLRRRTGQPVWVRFTSRAAEWAILLDPDSNSARPT